MLEGLWINFAQPNAWKAYNWISLKNFLYVLEILIEWFKGSSFGMTPPSPIFPVPNDPTWSLFKLIILSKGYFSFQRPVTRFFENIWHTWLLHVSQLSQQSQLLCYTQSCQSLQRFSNRWSWFFLNILSKLTQGDTDGTAVPGLPRYRVDIILPVWSLGLVTKMQCKATYQSTVSQKMMAEHFTTIPCEPN